MKTKAIIGLLLATGIAVFAQNPLNEVLKMGYGDVAATKLKAEAGDPQAQLSLADTLAFNFKSADALNWYRKAAGQGSVEARSRIGEMLLFGHPGIPTTQNVPPNPMEGIRWTFEAATNFNAKACLNMSKALENGIGVRTNLIEAYAWLQLYSDSNATLGRIWLNQLALKLDARSIQEAQQMAAEFKSGHWPVISPRIIPEGDPRLKLEGITFGGKTALAIINGKTLAAGETTGIFVGKEPLEIKCLQIKQDSVLVLIDGEDQPRWLRLK